MKILREKQYAAFAANAKTLDSLRRNEVSYVPGVYEVAKVIILSKEDFEKLSEDVSPEYPFLKDNRELMSADPGGLFRCLMVRAEGEKENMLIAQRKDTLYLGYGRDYRSVDLQGVPVEHIALEEPKAYQEHAVFYHRPSHISDLNGQNPLRPVPERQTCFQVEQVVILCDEQFRQFQENIHISILIFKFFRKLETLSELIHDFHKDFPSRFGTHLAPSLNDHQLKHEAQHLLHGKILVNHGLFDIIPKK